MRQEGQTVSLLPYTADNLEMGLMALVMSLRLKEGLYVEGCQQSKAIRGKE